MRSLASRAPRRFLLSRQTLAPLGSREALLDTGLHVGDGAPPPVVTDEPVSAQSAYEPRPASLMVVDGSSEARLRLERDLRERGYEVSAYSEAFAALHEARFGNPDLLVIDVDLPDLHGHDLCRRARAWTSVPILLMSVRDDPAERAEGLRSGADDYMRKPVHPDELVERVAAILRRTVRQARQLRFEDLVLDVERYRCFRGGSEIALTPTEFSILETLARLPERVVSRHTLAAVVWPESEYLDDRLLDSHVTHLRHKLEVGGARRLVHTIRGVGLTLR